MLRIIFLVHRERLGEQLVIAPPGERGFSIEARRAGLCVASFLACLQSASTGIAADSTGALLVEPPICSVFDTGRPQQPMQFCFVEPANTGELEQPSIVNLALTATTSPIRVGGYKVVTENYNGTYLPPVVELGAGDTLKVRLLNALADEPHAHASAAGAASHPVATNLHTHGWIVPPKNGSDPLRGNGDNVFVALKRGEWLDYSISIPVRLPASVLDGKLGEIAHPNGPYWYHSHLHGLSEGQVSGGMSGLMSIGRRDANLVARDPDPRETEKLRAVTNVKYLMLRDIKLTSSVSPVDADGASPAEWMRDAGANPCYPKDVPGMAGEAIPANPEEREGFCQSPVDKRAIWLFTVNGQRFPTLKVSAGRNALLRLANLSANVSYMLSFEPDKPDGRAPLTFDLLSVDGVVPGAPLSLPELAAAGGVRPESVRLTSLLLMPAARAEIYLRNDGQGEAQGIYLLRTAEQCTNAQPQQEGEHRGQCDPDVAEKAENDVAGDHWPEIQLAKVEFEPLPQLAAADEAPRLALNTPFVEIGRGRETVEGAEAVAAAAALGAAKELPAGCLRDIDKSAREHRRITFGGRTTGEKKKWRVRNQIVRPPDDSGDLFPPERFKPVEDAVNANTDFLPFDAYLDEDKNVDWEATGERPKHPCIVLSDGTETSSGHGQLWEIHNASTELHNFHIHQMKFRLAREDELKAYGIKPDTVERAFSNRQLAAFREQESISGTTWHDTLPVPGRERVFIIMNFDAVAQLGRFVFHCHILEHEDAGLMTPMEVIR